jgi:hypothetical protein
VDGESEASAGQLHLQRHHQSRTLHVTVDFPVEKLDYEPSAEDVTPVGFDIGEAHSRVVPASRELQLTRSSSTVVALVTSAKRCPPR